MNLSDPQDPEEIQNSRARRRRARRQVIEPLTPDEKSNYIDEVAKRASPSFDFFLFSLVAGLVMGVGYLLDSPHLLIAGALIAPLMSPLVGVGLGTVLGSAPYFGRSIGGFLLGSLLVFLAGALAGLAGRIWMPLNLMQVHVYTQLTVPPCIVVGAGAVLTTATLVKQRFNPAIPSVALAYGLYLPLSAAGFGMGSGLTSLVADGLVLFAIYMAWVTLLMAAASGVMGFRPYSLFGYSIGGVIALVGIILVIGFSGAGAVLGGQIALPTSPPSVTPSLAPTKTLTATPAPPTASFTPSLTSTQTLTPTITSTPTATPVEALVKVNEEYGAVVRDKPDGNIISTLFNGSVVIMLGDTAGGNGGRTWAHVYSLENQKEGWVLRSLLVTATPAPTVTPPPTATRTQPPTATQAATKAQTRQPTTSTP
jgi:hypothetical protein